MRADFFQRTEYRAWQGQGAANNGDNIFVISDQVPQGEAWKILAASIRAGTIGNDAFYLFAIPPAAFNVYPRSALFSKTGVLQNYLPLASGVFLSQGGRSTNFAVEEIANTQNSINALPVGRRGFYLPPGWGFLVSMEPTAGGTGNSLVVTLSVAMVRVGLDECLC